MAREPIEPILITDPNRQRVGTGEELEFLARLMDSVFEIPGTGIRFGLDPILGLVPGLGDTLSSVVSFYILQAANRAGVPRVTLVRMAANIGIDYVVGVVPLIGDVFDVAWKANVKNVALLRAHVQVTPTEQRRARTGDWWFVAGLVLALIALLVGCVTITLGLWGGLWKLLHG